jgi:hypothetical protein
MEQSNEEKKIQPVVFHGKHPLLAKTGQQKEVSRKVRSQQKRRPYPAKNRS